MASLAQLASPSTSIAPAATIARWGTSQNGASNTTNGTGAPNIGDLAAAGSRATPASPANPSPARQQLAKLLGNF